MNITYRRSIQEDAEKMVDVYNQAFYDDYVRYGSCPGYGQSIEHMRKSIDENIKYAILDDDRIVGAISVSDKKEGSYYIGCLCVIPEYQGKQIGTKAIHFIEQELIGWKEFTLETPADKIQNVKFYTEKCGFTITEKIKDGNVELYHFIKKSN